MDVLSGLRALARATWWRSALWYLACLLSLLFAVSFAEQRTGSADTEVMGGPWVLLWLVGALLAVLVFFRYRWPWQVTVAASVATLALPVDPLLPLVGLMHVWRACAWRTVALVTPLVTAATFVATWRDTRGHTQEESLWQLLFASPGTPGTGEALAWWIPVVITVLCVVAFAGIGGLRRELARSEAKGESHRLRAEQLGDEVVRQAERERIAREVHDAIGHRLSLLSVHAGALEANTRDQDPRLAGSATLVRESAARTASDLRSLLSVLRRPDDPDLAAAVPGLDAVPGLVDESIEAGMPLVATVRIEGESGLDPFGGQTAHRITQELLTNARRHAPGAGVRLAFVARPADGVTIEVANRRREQPAHVEGGGLTGVRERAARVDGEAHVTVDDEGNFRVAVRLPWRQAQRMEPR